MSARLCIVRQREQTHRRRPSQPRLQTPDPANSHYRIPRHQPRRLPATATNHNNVFSFGAGGRVSGWRVPLVSRRARHCQRSCGMLLVELLTGTKPVGDQGLLVSVREFAWCCPPSCCGGENSSRASTVDHNATLEISQHRRHDATGETQPTFEPRVCGPCDVFPL